MGLLVGLPLKLFHILFVMLRLAWPLLLALAIYWFLRRRRQGAGGSGQGGEKTAKTPDFDGPVVEVEYRVLDEDEGK